MVGTREINGPKTAFKLRSMMEKERRIKVRNFREFSDQKLKVYLFQIFSPKNPESPSKSPERSVPSAYEYRSCDILKLQSTASSSGINPSPEEKCSCPHDGHSKSANLVAVGNVDRPESESSIGTPRSKRQKCPSQSVSLPPTSMSGSIDSVTSFEASELDDVC